MVTKHCTLIAVLLLLRVALDVTQRIIENTDDWSTLFKPSDFFQKYKYAPRSETAQIYAALDSLLFAL